MNTTELLEGWGTDLGELARYLTDHVGDVPLVLGGSLANNLGGAWSDIDVFAFGDVEPDGRFARQQSLEDAEGPVVRAFGRLHRSEIDLQVFRTQPLTGIGSSLRSMLDPLASTVPVVQTNYIPALHALASGVPINDKGLEPLRIRSGADLLSVWLALRAIAGLQVFVADAAAMVRNGEVLGTLSQMRLASEAAIDAVLGVSGSIHPNPKWRVTLALRAAMDRTIPVSSEDVLGALYPDPSRLEASAEVITRAIGVCVAAILADPMLRGYAAVDDLRASRQQLHELLRTLPGLLGSSTTSGARNFGAADF